MAEFIAPEMQNAALQKNTCLKPDTHLDCASQRRFGALLLGRFLPKLGGIARCRHFFCMSTQQPNVATPHVIDYYKLSKKSRKLY
jgi:hypothetical protein